LLLPSLGAPSSLVAAVIEDNFARADVCWAVQKAIGSALDLTMMNELPSTARRLLPGNPVPAATIPHRQGANDSANRPDNPPLSMISVWGAASRFGLANAFVKNRRPRRPSVNRSLPTGNGDRGEHRPSSASTMSRCWIASTELLAGFIRWRFTHGTSAINTLVCNTNAVLEIKKRCPVLPVYGERPTWLCCFH
jgi:hypothetical protein